MTRGGFADHFSGHAADYARFRPDYPAALLDWIAARAPGRGRAWDCATGSGQAAAALAERFAEVVATDASVEQVARARPHPRVRYAVAPAEASGLPASSVDAVTVAQALHWFRIPDFLAEAWRVLRPGGLLAAWSYDLMEVSEEVDRVVLHLYRDVVGAYWPPERAMVEDGGAGYRALDLALFEDVEAPEFAMEGDWTLGELAGYLRTWSSVRRFAEAEGRDPVEALLPALREAWGEPEGTRRVRWPLTVRAGRRER